MRGSTKCSSVRIWERGRKGVWAWDGGWLVESCGKDTEQKWGTEMGKDKSPPADSGSFCKAVGLVSEAYGGSPEWTAEWSDWTNGCQVKRQKYRGGGAIEEMSSSPKKPQNDPLSTVPRCASLSASFNSEIFSGLNYFLIQKPKPPGSVSLHIYVYIFYSWSFWEYAVTINIKHVII